MCNPIEILSDPLLFFTVTPKSANSDYSIETNPLGEES